jgi:5'-3' exonuclease
MCYIQAPSEAELQLVKLEQQGLIDGILSEEDGDVLCLGGQIMASRVKFDYKSPKASTKQNTSGNDLLQVAAGG